MIVLALILAAAGQTPPLPAPPPVDCNDADHRALDFWIGDWDVEAKAAGIKVAHSRIEKIAGCAISETYDQFLNRAGKPVEYHGRSISSYVPADHRWQQFYIDSSGGAATLLGNVQGGAMILVSHLGPVTSRMTIKALPDGTVEQSGETSTDDGKTWSPAYDFIYRRRAP